MMKARSLFYLAILSLFIVCNPVCAEDWVLIGQTATGDMFYDKSSIYEDGNILRVWTKDIYNKDGKANTYEILKQLGHAIVNPETLSHQLILREFDCANGKMQSTSLTIYTVEGTSVFSQQKSFNEWKDIPNPTLESLEKIVCGSTNK